MLTLTSTECNIIAAALHRDAADYHHDMIEAAVARGADAEVARHEALGAAALRSARDLLAGVEPEAQAKTVASLRDPARRRAAAHFARGYASGAGLDACDVVVIRVPDEPGAPGVHLHLVDYGTVHDARSGEPIRVADRVDWMRARDYADPVTHVFRDLPHHDPDEGIVYLDGPAVDPLT